MAAGHVTAITLSTQNSARAVDVYEGTSKESSHFDDQCKQDFFLF